MKLSKGFSAALYIRLSREDGDKEESDSVGNQRKLLEGYLAENSELVLYDFYVDDGYSGTNFNRPGFRSMMGAIEAGNVNCVVVKDLSRFGRDYIETGRYLERYFPEMGVRFISVTDGIDSMKQVYDMLLPIKNIFNEQYARDISKKIQATMKAKQRAGEFIGAFASYGYRKSPVDKNKLVVDPYAASVVRRIFDLYLQGYGKQRIAKLLNEEGVLCPSEYKKVNGEKYRNCNRLETANYWSYSTVNSILHKEMYAGNMVQGTKHQKMRGRQTKIPKEDWIVVEDTHEPIIDRETWEKAQDLLTKRTRMLDLETNKNIFAGFVKCGDCGRAMVKNMWRQADGSKHCRFYCGTYKRNGKGYCTPHALPLEVLEDIVLNSLNEMIKSTDNLRELAELQKERQPQDLRMNRADKGCHVGTDKGSRAGADVRKYAGVNMGSHVGADRGGHVGADVRKYTGVNMGSPAGADRRGCAGEVGCGKIAAELVRVRFLKKSVYEDYREGLITREEYFTYRDDYLKKEELYVKQMDALEKSRQEETADAAPETPWLKDIWESGRIKALNRDMVVEMISEIKVYEDRRMEISYKFGK